MHHLLAHYTAATVAPLAAGAAASVSSALLRATPGKKAAVRRACAAYLLASAAGHALLSGLMPPGRVWMAERAASSGRAEEARAAADVRRLAAMIPPGASVGFVRAEQAMLPLARSRRLYYPLPYAPRSPEAPIDVWFTPADEAPPDSEAFRLVGRGGKIALWRRAPESPPRPSASP